MPFVSRSEKILPDTETDSQLRQFIQCTDKENDTPSNKNEKKLCEGVLDGMVLREIRMMRVNDIGDQKCASGRRTKRFAYVLCSPAIHSENKTDRGKKPNHKFNFPICFVLSPPHCSHTCGATKNRANGFNSTIPSSHSCDAVWCFYAAQKLIAVSFVGWIRFFHVFRILLLCAGPVATTQL